MADVFNSVPEPTDTMEGLLATVKALKHVVDTLTDTSNQAGLAPTRTFHQTDAPAAVVKGDQWVKPATIKGESNLMAVWDGSEWRDQSSIPTGCVIAFMGEMASTAECPQGFILPYGQQVERLMYPGLFATLRVTYGVGDGSTTFNVPDLRGRVVAGIDNMGGTTASRVTNAGSGVVGTTLGAAGGGETHTLTTAQIPAHAHTFPYGAHTHTNTGSGVYTGTAGAAPPIYQFFGTDNAGGGAAHPNLQPTIMGWMLLKT